MDILIAPVVLVWMALPVAVVLVPPIVAAAYGRLTTVAVVLYAAALGLTVAFGAASLAHMEWADETGGTGSMFAGGTWLVVAAVAAATSVAHTVRGRRQPATS